MAVLFDEVFARVACPCLPKGIAVTANLNVDYRAPGHPGRVYVLRARTVEVEGRKAWVEGGLEMLIPKNITTITTATATATAATTSTSSGMMGKEQDSSTQQYEPVLVAEAKALFVEPKFAEVRIYLFPCIYIYIYIFPLSRCDSDSDSGSDRLLTFISNN
jgi:hypothetical protein